MNADAFQRADDALVAVVREALHVHGDHDLLAELVEGDLAKLRALVVARDLAM